MSALALGLIAAVAWGFHDICVRYLSQTVPLLAALLTVLVVGLLFHLGLMTVEAGFAQISFAAMAYSVAAGALFLGASLGLYAAFQRGPVRLVAPIIASYPILSVGWAAIRGADVSWGQLLAVLAIILGVSVVAALSGSRSEDVPSKGPTILYALIASIYFAGTFAVGQIAVEMSEQLPVTLITRIVAVALLVVLMWFKGEVFWAGFSALPLLFLMGVADAIALVSVLSAGGLPDAQYAAVAASVFGVLTIVMAWAFLREPMTVPQWVGCLVTFCGIGYLAL